VLASRPATCHARAADGHPEFEEEHIDFLETNLKSGKWARELYPNKLAKRLQSPFRSEGRGLGKTVFAPLAASRHDPAPAAGRCRSRCAAQRRVNRMRAGQPPARGGRYPLSR
jgi:hypothetical protein